jgi:hypothetical protein
MMVKLSLPRHKIVTFLTYHLSVRNRLQIRPRGELRT